jgi:hypothetical protein
MAKKPAVQFDASFFLQLSLGAFFLMMGIMGLGNYNSKLSEIARALGRDDQLRVVMSLVELVMGIVLVSELFVSLSANIAKLLSLTLFGFWILYMLISLVLNGRFMEPNAVVWLYNLAWHTVILTALWIVGRKYLA